MSTEFFWQDLWLKIWWFLNDTSTVKAALLVMVCGFMIYFEYLRTAKRRGMGVSDIVIYIVGIICVVLCIASIFAPKMYPYVYDHSPETSVKEELRQKALTEGDTVWVVKRDESGTPIAIDEHIIFAKKSNSILVDEALTIDGVYSGNDGSPTVLGSYPISDCYSDKDEAAATIGSALKEDS